MSSWSWAGLMPFFHLALVIPISTIQDGWAAKKCDPWLVPRRSHPKTIFIFITWLLWKLSVSRVSQHRGSRGVKIRKWLHNTVGRNVSHARRLKSWYFFQSPGSSTWQSCNPLGIVAALFKKLRCFTDGHGHLKQQLSQKGSLMISI